MMASNIFSHAKYIAETQLNVLSMISSICLRIIYLILQEYWRVCSKLKW